MTVGKLALSIFLALVAANLIAIAATVQTDCGSDAACRVQEESPQ